MMPVVQRDRSGRREPETQAGPFLRLLLRRRGLVLVVALLLMVLAGVVGRDAGDELTSGAYLDPSAESQRAAALLTQEFPGGPPNSLFLVTRFREERRAGRTAGDAVVITVRTARPHCGVLRPHGGSLALGAAALPDALPPLLGYAGIAVTALAALTAVVLIPAMLALIGHRLDRADLFAPIRPRPHRPTTRSHRTENVMTTTYDAW